MHSLLTLPNTPNIIPDASIKYTTAIADKSCRKQDEMTEFTTH